MTWSLYLDDLAMKERFPDKSREWLIARSTEEAKALVEKFGPPQFISFDHDLGKLPKGGTDEATEFVRWLIKHYYDAKIDYQIHSANPVGAENIHSLMQSWEKSRSYPFQESPFPDPDENW